MVTKKKIGRPSKLTVELIDNICKYISEGLYIDDACILCDITEWTYYQWLKVAETDRSNACDTIYTRFSQAIKKAEAQLAKDWLEEARLRGANKGQWVEVYRRLGSRFRAKWGQYETKQIEHKVDSKPLRVEVEIIGSTRRE